MIDAFTAATRWKKIIEYTNRIKDPVLKESVLAEYQQRAIQEWGFCPDKNNYKPQKIELDPWQEQFLKKIKACMEYGVFIKDEQTFKEAHSRMDNFIEKGGKFSDLPEDLQNEHIAKLYVDVMFEKIKECEDFLKKDIYKS